MADDRFFTCHCGWRMIKSSQRTIASHQEQHPTEEQRMKRFESDIEEMQRGSLARVASAMESGAPLSALDRVIAISAII